MAGRGASCFSRGLDLGLGLAAGCGRGALTIGWLFGGSLGFRLGRGCGPRRGVGFGGGGARLGGVPRGPGGGVLDEDVVVVVDAVVVVVEVVESEAEERAVGDGGGSWASGAGVGCWVLQVVRTRVRLWAPGVCARFPW